MTATTRSEEVRRNIVAAVIVFGAIAIGALVVVLATGGEEKGPAAPTTSQMVGPDGSVVPVLERPSSLPEANSGQAPEDSGDPGGWEQTMIFVLVVASMVVLGLVVARGSRRSRAARQRWVDAAAPGQEQSRIEARAAEIEHAHAGHADDPTV